MFINKFLVIYLLFIDSGNKRIAWIERYFNFDVDILHSLDEGGNEADIYSIIFLEENRYNLELLYSMLLSEMDGISYSDCSEFMDGMIFLQEILAKALWKYNLDVGEKMEKFARNFDRLDISSEKYRLYKQAQSKFED